MLTINNSFKNFEKSIKLADHAFNVSEHEYVTVTDNLKLQNEIKQRSISQLKEAIRTLNPNAELNISDSDDDLIHIISFLHERIAKAKELEVAANLLTPMSCTAKLNCTAGKRKACNIAFLLEHLL
jgi:hypothetical protein